MEKLSIIFPIAAVGFLLWLFWQYLPLLRGEPFSGRSFRYKLEKRELPVLIALTLLYAVVAFINLGDAKAPESFCHFTERGRYVVIETDGNTEISEFRYYTGLCTGSYYVQLSDDGEEYVDLGTMEQSYAELFKWMTYTPEGYFDTTPRYIRLVCDSELYLGELALYGPDGGRISPTRFIYNEGAATMFDEQELIPERVTFNNSTYFDEIYHARTAYENIEGVYPYEISHPPLGKIILSIGIRLLGMNPFGWRVMGTVFGILMLPLLYILIKRMFGSAVIATAGTILLATDFMHFVQTRIATIDTYAVFFIILMYLFMYLFMSSPPERQLNGGRRRALFLCGLSMGLGCACKWTCVYAALGLAVLWLCYWVDRHVELRREYKSRQFVAELGNCILWCLLFFVAIPVVIYYVSYYPYGRASGMDGIAMFLNKNYADIVWDNQKYMFSYHSGVTATHPYSSRWYQWMLDLRPILYYLDYYDDGTRSSFGAFVNPILCWGGLMAMLCMIWQWVADGDRRARFIFIGYMAQLAPWVLISRVTFGYHYFPSVIFLILAVCHVFDRFRRYSVRWRRRVWAFAGVASAVFVMFYPVLSGARINTRLADICLQWLGSWPF